ncbi:MAG: hypothetical protein KGK07_11590 [Chloroflexota bacterium]|nr:hypothetical protein [Chloroflexota bacterium]
MVGDADALRERDEALRRGDAAWQRLQEVLDAHIDTPLDGRAGWTGKDVYAHFARWQQRSIDELCDLLTGRWRPAVGADDEDTLNDHWAAEDASLGADDARARCLTTRAELRRTVAGLDAGRWQRFGRLFDDITGPHYEHHLRAAGG